MKEQHPFDAQFGPPEELAEWQEEFVSMLLNFKADKIEDPLGAVLEEMEDAFEWEVEPTRPDLERWYAEHEAEIERRYPLVLAERMIEADVDTFHDERRKGKSVAAIARKMKKEPAAILTLLQRSADRSDLETTQGVLAALQEERALKDYKARRQLYRMLAKKLEDALGDRDLSDVPTEKLMSMLLRLAEASKTDEPPRLSVSVGYKDV